MVERVYGQFVNIAVGGGYAIYESNKVSIDYTLNNHVVEYGEDQTKIDCSGFLSINIAVNQIAVFC